MSKPSVVVVGGGTIGLSIGWSLARRGADVRLLEQNQTGRGTSWLAAGMLAPSAEIEFEELDLYRLNRESRRRWPAFVQRLEKASGQLVDYREEGTLVVANDRDEAEALRRLYEFQRGQEVPVEWLSAHEALELEPFLHPRLAAAVHAPGDHQVDNRRLVQALRAAFLQAGGQLLEATKVQRCEPDPSTPAVVSTSGQRFEADAVVLAMGPWAQSIEGIDQDWLPPVRPVKGQVLQLQMEQPFDLQHVVRGPDAYLAPKGNGRLVIGATSEERGFDTEVTAGGLYRLLEGAWEVVPGIEELPVSETWAGLRPASRDHKPLLGWSEAPGVVYATGHYRHGILLTPVTAEEVADLVLTGEASKWLEPFSPKRFRSQPSLYR